MIDEHYRTMLNDIHEDMGDFSQEDLIDLVLWLEKQCDAIKNEAVSRLTGIGLEALKTLKATL